MPVITDRTIGTKRARTIARVPCFSKKFWVVTTYSVLKIFESGRLNRRGPTLAPVQYPNKFPAIADTVISTKATARGVVMKLLAISIPTMNRRESPGRITPTNSPHSINRIMQAAKSASPPKPLSKPSGSRNPAAWIDVANSNGVVAITI